MTPKANGLLQSETQLPPSEGSTPRDTELKRKKSMRRLSDILKGCTEVADLWIV